MNNIYKLEGKTPVPCENLHEWAKWFEKSDRQVRRTIVDHVQISTVFLGCDHSFGQGKPLLFETMVFGGRLDGETKRYSTWDEAEKGHERMAWRVMNAIDSRKVAE